MVEGIAHAESKSRPERIAETGMTKRTGVKPLLPGKVAGAEDIPPGDAIGGVRGMPGNMAPRIAVAAAAANTQYDTGPVVGDGSVSVVNETGGGRMAFHTISRNLFVEIHEIRGKTGTVAPGIGGTIPRYRQLKEPVVIPI